MRAEGAKVLVLDTKEQIAKFRALMENATKFNFYYAESLEEAIEKIYKENIPIVLVGCKINGHVAEEIPDIILKETNKPIHVILNSFDGDTCKFSRKAYLQSPLFDVIWPTINPEKITRRILVALEAHELEVSSSSFFFAEGEEP